MICNNFKLTEKQFDWFGDRLHESASGRVLVPGHCYKKFKKIIDNEFLNNDTIKDWLTDRVYNCNAYYSH